MLFSTFVFASLFCYSQTYVVNNSSGFIDVGQLLLQSLNPSVDPCDDFYEFVCGNYASDIRSVLQNTTDIHERIINRISSVDNDSSLTERIFRHALLSCTLPETMPSNNGVHQMKQILDTELGGLPMLTPGWNRTWKNVFFAYGSFKTKYETGMKILGLSHLFNDNLLSATTPKQLLSNKELDKMKNIVKLFASKIGIKQDINAWNDDIRDIKKMKMFLEIYSPSSSTSPSISPKYFTERLSITRIKEIYPHVDLDSYYQGLGRNIPSHLLYSPRQYNSLDYLIRSKKILPRTVINALGLEFLYNNIEFLDASLGSENCIEFVAKHMPNAAGYLYGDSRSDREAAVNAISNVSQSILDSFIDVITDLDWMDKESMKALVEKKNLVKINIGWPSWYDFENTSVFDERHELYHGILDIDVEDYFSIKNALIKAYQSKYHIPMKLDNIFSFDFEVTMINAFYIKEMNEITIPLGIISWPFYDLGFPTAFNYGGIGSVISHELVHGFDVNGIFYDKLGNKKCDWQTCSTILSKNSTSVYDAMSRCVEQQYSAECCPSKASSLSCINGKRTVGENVADIGGVRTSYEAFIKSAHANGEGRIPGLEHFTSRQIFWLSHAYHWCQSNKDNQFARPEEHSPDKCRVNQVVKNIPEFGVDFKCPRGSRLYPEDEKRCKVWSN